jgi:hypothetical protein
VFYGSLDAKPASSVFIDAFDFIDDEYIFGAVAYSADLVGPGVSADDNAGVFLAITDNFGLGELAYEGPLVFPAGARSARKGNKSGSGYQPKGPVDDIREIIPVVQKGDPAPSAGGAVFHTFLNPGLSRIFPGGFGGIAFQAVLKNSKVTSPATNAKNNRGVWLYPSGSESIFDIGVEEVLLARKGDVATDSYGDPFPDDAKFRKFNTRPLVGRFGTVFGAKISGDGVNMKSNYGIWSACPNCADGGLKVRNIVREGELVDMDGVGAGVKYKTIREYAASPLGFVAWRAILTGNRSKDQGLFIDYGYGAELLLRKGDSVLMPNGKADTVKKISLATKKAGSGGSDGLQRWLHPSGLVVAIVKLKNYGSAVVVTFLQP